MSSKESATENEESAAVDATDAMMEQKSTSSDKNSRSDKACYTWKDAHYSRCKANGCLSLSPQQVQQAQPSAAIKRPRMQDAILKDDPDAAKKVASHVTEVDPSSPHWIFRVATSMYWAASFVTQKVLAATIDEDFSGEEEITAAWEDPNDDYVDSSVALVEWNQSVICVDLVVECVQQVLQSLDNDKLVALDRRRAQGTPELTFYGHCRNNDSSVLQDLPEEDLDLIARVLVEAGRAVICKDNYLVFGGDDETQRDAAASLVQLKQAIASTEHQVAMWTEAFNNCKHRASAANKKNQMSKALFELRKSKMLNQNMESARASLLNLEQAHQGLETAQLQQYHVLKPLEAASNALKSLREEHSIEDIEELHDELREELDHLQVEPPSLGQDFDEEELMLELNRLSLEDEPGTEASLPPVPETVGSQPDSKTDKETTDIDAPQLSLPESSQLSMQESSEEYKKKEHEPTIGAL